MLKKVRRRLKINSPLRLNKYDIKKFIEETLEKTGISCSIPCVSESTQNDFRYLHELSVYSLGLILSRFLRLKKFIADQFPKKDEDGFLLEWTIASLRHDSGLNRSIGFIRLDDLEDFQGGHYFLKEIKPPLLRYPASFYRLYFKYEYREQERNGLEPSNPNWCYSFGNEIGDHGIMGGILLYDDLLSKYTSFPEPISSKFAINLPSQTFPIPLKMSQSEWTTTAQIISSAIADHNIWKISIEVLCPPWKQMIDYKHYIAITEDRPLLLLLALADTIEFSKRFYSKKVRSN